MEKQKVLCVQKDLPKRGEIDYFANYFFTYFEENQKEYVCTVTAIIRDDIMTISRKGEKIIHLRIKELENFEGSDNPWCVYDSSKFKIQDEKNGKVTTIMMTMDSD